MKTLSRLLSAVLIVQMVATPLASEAGASQGRKASAKSAPTKEVDNHTVLRLLRKQVSENPAYYYSDQDLAGESASFNQALAIESLKELKQKIADPTVSMRSIRETLIKQTVAEEEAQRIELGHVIGRMPPESLDQTFEESFRRGGYSEDLRAEYLSAYTADEKRLIVYSMAMLDLQNVKSATLKRLGLLTREQLAKETAALDNLLQVKDRDTWRTVLVVVLAVAAAGFASYAIISATQTRWERRTNQLERDHDRRTDDYVSDHDRRMRDYENQHADRMVRLRQDWAGREEELRTYWATREQELRALFANREAGLRAVFEERARLRDQGYVWAICSTTSTPRTASCSYDGQIHTGDEVCVTRCLKNPNTGHAVQTSQQCTSAFIPSNCYQANPYMTGYNPGYRDGYETGYNTGYDRAYVEAYNDYYNPAYDEGYYDGDWDGSYDGYYDGQHDGAQAGNQDGSNDGWNAGADEGSYWGAYDGAYDGDYDGWEDGVYYGSADGFGDGYDLGYANGYDDGWDQAYWDDDKSSKKKQLLGEKKILAAKKLSDRIGKSKSTTEQVKLRAGFKRGYRFGYELASMLRLGS